MNLRDLLADIRQNCSGIPADWIQFDVKYLTEIAASIEKSLTNRCRNCRHWADNTDDDIGALASDGPTHPMDAWPCLHPKIGGGYSGEEHKSSDAVNSYSTIITGPEFGCIHFEEVTK